jgi:hypothetical protein
VTPYVNLTVLKKGARISGTINRDLDVGFLPAEACSKIEIETSGSVNTLIVTMKRKDYARIVRLEGYDKVNSGGKLVAIA